MLRTVIVLCFVTASVRVDGTVVDGCTCEAYDSYYSPNSTNGCRSFYHTTAPSTQRFVPLNEQKCPDGLLFDLQNCYCNWPSQVTCPQGCPVDYDCRNAPCDSNAGCVNTGGSFTCECNSGYTGDGFTCADIDECRDAPCDSNAGCVNTMGGFTCECNSGYTGDGFSCADVDECRDAPCDANAQCINAMGNFTCECNSGYTGDGFTCVDVDECRGAPCHADAECDNTVGSFTCGCNGGYTGDGFTCADVDECRGAPCDVNAECDNTVGNFTCGCNGGYTGDGFTCTDVDECRGAPCDVNAECDNTVGNFTCECISGYTGDGFTCADIDECHGAPCDVNAECGNTVGNFTCECNGGYTGAGFTCADIDECHGAPCHADAECVNTGGSFTCECKSGYTGDGFTCADVDECRGAPCHANAGCINTVGSFTCECKSGYTGDGFTCADVDECRGGPCDLNAECDNTGGNFTCGCNGGYTGDGFTCREVNYCCAEPRSDVITPGLYPFGYRTGDSNSGGADDGCLASFHHNVIMFRQIHSTVYVCQDGVVSTSQQTFHSPGPFPSTSGRGVIAAFWADGNTRESGAIWHRETRNEALLNQISLDVNSVFNGDFTANWGLIATWQDIKGFGFTDRPETNTFQTVVVTDDVDTYAIYTYDHIEWPITTSSRQAQMAYDAGDGENFFQDPLSRTPEIINIDNRSNIGVPGKFIFRLTGTSNDPTNPCHNPCGNLVCINQPEYQSFTCSA